MKVIGIFVIAICSFSRNQYVPVIIEHFANLIERAINNFPTDCMDYLKAAIAALYYLLSIILVLSRLYYVFKHKGSKQE